MKFSVSLALVATFLVTTMRSTYYVQAQKESRRGGVRGGGGRKSSRGVGGKSNRNLRQLSSTSSDICGGIFPRDVTLTQVNF